MSTKLITDRLSTNIEVLKALCEKYNVHQLYIFGSILTDKFSNDSDVDFAVTFHPMTVENYADNYFSLKEELENLVGRDVDLVEYKAIRNPYFLAELDRTKHLLYG